MGTNYKKLDVTAAIDSDNLAKMGDSLGRGIASNSKAVPGFLVHAVELIRTSGNKTPLLTFLKHLNGTKDVALVARIVGVLGGAMNNGKPRIVIKMSDSKTPIKWDSSFREENGGTLDKGARDVLMSVHNVESFRGKTVSELLKKPTPAFDAKKKVETFIKALKGADMSDNDILALLRETTREIEGKKAAAAAPARAA